MIKCAIFDLDGTLIDTSIDLGRATDYVLKCYGIIPKWTQDDYIGFVGNGAKKLLDRAFEHRLSDSQLDEALELFKLKYNQILLENAYAYDGIVEQLSILKEKGIALAVVTNKPDESAIIMVEAVFGKDTFDLIIGASENTPKKPDPYSSNLVLDKLNVSPKEAVFFGDSDVDVLTAKNAGVKSVACSWGFRSVDVLISVHPDIIIDSPKKILNIFSKKC